MKMSTRALAAAGLTLPLLVMALPAEAGSRWSYRSSGSSISASWTELGQLTGVAGNAHVGYLDVDPERDEAYGSVRDWTCPEGELPPSGGGGHHVAEEEPTSCVLESVREMYAGDTAIDVELDRKLTTGTITGNLSVVDHDGGGATAAPPVEMTITGIGEVYSSTSYYTDSGDGWTSRYKDVTSLREGVVDGHIGAMGFTDDADDVSSASMRRYRTYERGMSR
ncbi:MAG TPA: hypothetical protein VF728_09475 [Nocardioides sp.]|jgi:hypothetical protein